MGACVAGPGRSGTVEGARTAHPAGAPVITSDTLTANADDLTEVRAALEALHRIAAAITARDDVRPAHELAAADLANLRAAVDAAGTAPRFEELWAMFVFAGRLAAPNEFPDLADGDPFSFRFGHRPSAAQRRRLSSGSRLLWNRPRRSDIAAMRAEDDTAATILELRFAVEAVEGAVHAALDGTP